MKTPEIAGGVAHIMPSDFKEAIISDPAVLDLWNSITPLARNEWICWVTSGALAETRIKRIKVGMSKMSGGMRRPCCWVGCVHRTDKALSPTAKWVMSKQAKPK